jgi:L-malate glycosyltransferase
LATDRAQLISRPPSTRPEKGVARRLAVCHLISGDLWAGAEAQTASLLKALARRPGLRLSAILLNEGELARRLRDCGIDVRVIPESSRNFFQIFSDAAEFLNSRQVQILHSHRYKENVLAALLARRCRIPLLVHTRHGAPEPFRGWSHLKHGAVGVLDYVAARFAADRVISVSNELRDRLVRHLPAEKVVTIANGIDTDEVFSHLTKSEAQRRLGLPEGAKVVGYAGRLVPIKRLDIFLQAAKQMSTADPSVQFVIAGDGPDAARLRALARELGLDDRVRFLGYRADIYDAFRAMDVFILCSDHEGLPISLLEAMYLGVPVVARPVGGIPEMIQDGVTGILLRAPDPDCLADACLRLLAHVGFRERVAMAATQAVGKIFSVEESAERTARLYGELGRQ